jgi:hypothetical protein
MWWCTVEDHAQAGALSTKERGHFWLNCKSPWSNKSLNGTRTLLTANLPGYIGATAGFRATVAKPSAHEAIWQVIADQVDEVVDKAVTARREYEHAIETLISRLGWKDFELLIDLILSQGGWARIERLGGTTAIVDLEVRNGVTGERINIQVKSRASQSDLKSFVEDSRNSGAAKLIFAYHKAETGQSLHLEPDWDTNTVLWDRASLARRALAAGLGEWLEGRI